MARGILRPKGRLRQVLALVRLFLPGHSAVFKKNTTQLISLGLLVSFAHVNVSSCTKYQAFLYLKKHRC